LTITVTKETGCGLEGRTSIPARGRVFLLTTGSRLVLAILCGSLPMS
jgi:hypothetical protein